MPIPEYTPPPAFLASTRRQSGEDWKHKTDELLFKTDKGRTIILAGGGIELKVTHDALHIHDGKTHDPQPDQEWVLYRGNHEVERIVSVNPHRPWSPQVARWCMEQGICLEMYNDFGDLELSNWVTGRDKAVGVTLRKAPYQANDEGNPTGLLITRLLIAKKMSNEVRTLRLIADTPFDPSKRKGIQKSSDEYRAKAEKAAMLIEQTVPKVESVDAIRYAVRLEDHTSRLFYTVLRTIPLTWRRRDRQIVEKTAPHWLIVGPRSSPLSGRTGGTGASPRHANNPANAIRNYAFGVLRFRCRLAAAIVGLDPQCGFFHVYNDEKLRDNLAYDIMEPFRPLVEEKVLALIDATTFTWGDFERNSDGEVLLHGQFHKFVVHSCSIPRKLVVQSLDPITTILRQS